MAGNQGKIGGNPLDIIADYLRMIMHLDIWQFNLMLRKLRLKTNKWKPCLGSPAIWIWPISVGGFGNPWKGYCIPTAGRKCGERCICIWKADGIRCLRILKNSIRADRGVLLTGSNASGKSTFLKMVAVNAVLAQTIHTCTAESYHAPVFRIFSSMALRDSIKNGESYLYCGDQVPERNGCSTVRSGSGA